VLHGFKVSGEGMIGAGDEDEPLGFRGCNDDLLQVSLWGEPIAVAAEEELGELAAGEERVVKLVTEPFCGKPKGGKSMNLGARCGSIVATGDESHGGTEAEPDDDGGEMELCMQPVEGGRHVC